MKKLRGLVIDSFAGGGGAGLGIAQALGRSADLAINHDAAAIDMYQANHPDTRTMHEDVWNIYPHKAVGRHRKVALLWASPDCFPAGTLVLTKTGLKAIEQVAIGEFVLTHKNRWRHVTQTMSKVADTVSVRGHGHYGIVTTAEHQIYSKHITKRYPSAGLDGKRPGEVRTLVENPYWPEARDMAGKLWATPLRVPPTLMPLCEGAQFSEDLFYFLGRWVGDGSLNKGDVEVCCGAAEFNDLVELFRMRPLRNADGHRVEFRIVDHGASKLIVWGNARLVDWLRAEFGDSCETKSVPAWLLGAQASWRRAFLEGYVDADGHTKDGVATTSSVSRALSIGIRMLVVSLGFVPTMYLTKGIPGEIEGRKFIGRDSYQVRWRKELERDQCYRDTNHLFSPVREVNQTGVAETVFCLEVDEDESYTADGIVVHNCKDFSRAKGDKPVSKNIRSLAWVVIKWADQVKPKVIILENVREFEGWGPVVPAWQCAACDWKGTEGQAILKRQRRRCPRCESLRLKLTGKFLRDPKREGLTFRRWVGRLRNLGYRVEWKTLNAADYGAPTHRRRLFLVARRDGLPIAWPEPTHGNPKKLDEQPLFSRLKPWRTAAECIDWSIPCPSIFDRKKPLAEATMRRIAMGIKRYVLENQRPFIVRFRGSPDSGAVDIDEPMPTVTAGSFIKRPAGAGHALGICEPTLIGPFVAGVGGRMGQSPEASVDQPSNTVTAKNDRALVSPTLVGPFIVGAGGPSYSGKPRDVEQPMGTLIGENHAALVSPYLVPLTHSGEVRTNSVEDPMATITTAHRGEVALIAPTLIQTGYGERDGQAPRAPGLEKPLGTAVSGGCKHALVAAFLAKHFGGVVGHEVERPLGTVTSIDHHSLVAANLIHLNHGEKQWSGPDDPLRTQTTSNHAALVYSFLVKYFGTAIGQHVLEPLHTATEKDRFGLVTVTIDGELYVIADIGMRMLTPRELARAQGFPDTYILTGTKTSQVARIGNSVCPAVAKAIVEANFAMEGATA